MLHKENIIMTLDRSGAMTGINQSGKSGGDATGLAGAGAGASGGFGIGGSGAGAGAGGIASDANARSTGIGAGGDAGAGAGAMGAAGGDATDNTAIGSINVES
jgi:hypothetical protein